MIRVARRFDILFRLLQDAFQVGVNHKRDTFFPDIVASTTCLRSVI